MAKLREHLTTYVLASLSNAFLAASQYLAVSSAVASYLPVDSSTSSLITNYGRGFGILLALLLNSLIFEGVLAVLVVTLALSAAVKTGWKWAYTFSGITVSGFVAYWLGSRFLVILEWISTLQYNRIDVSNVYTGLFWLGLGATVCYVTMILVLRRTYGTLSETHDC